jgi:hypothetical protein
MHFWNTRSLALDLQAGRLDGRQQAGYLLATIILWSADLAAYTLTTLDHPHWALPSIALDMLAMITGVLWCASINRRGDDRHLVERIVCLSLPLTLRFLVASIPAALAVAPILVVERSDAVALAVRLGLSAAFDILFFIRLGRWMAVAAGCGRTEGGKREPAPAVALPLGPVGQGQHRDAAGYVEPEADGLPALVPQEQLVLGSIGPAVAGS